MYPKLSGVTLNVNVSLVGDVPLILVQSQIFGDQNYIYDSKLGVN